MSGFIKGLELCESFFNDCALPIIRRHYPELRFSAGLLGYGSDVLGYDDSVSSDHMWGPRFYLFLNKADFHFRDELMERFEGGLPYEYKGFSVNFSLPDPNDNGVRHAEFISSGKVSPLIWIHTVESFVAEYLGLIPSNTLDWLSMSEHKLLGFTSGKLFIDNLGLSEIRNSLSFYPRDVKLYLLASQWALIAEEQAFVKRCGSRDDTLGSRIVCTRIAERLMRLCYLYHNTYAPYSKWFGTGFKKLPAIGEIRDKLEAALSVNDLDEREKHLVDAQVLVATLHNASHITEEFEVRVQKYFGRDIDVIFPDKLAEKIKKEIADSDLRDIPLIGLLGQVGNFVEITENPCYIYNIRQLYESE